VTKAVVICWRSGDLRYLSIAHPTRLVEARPTSGVLNREFHRQIATPKSKRLRRTLSPGNVGFVATTGIGSTEDPKSRGAAGNSQKTVVGMGYSTAAQDFVGVLSRCCLEATNVAVTLGL
jgi:hypothetical protein